MPLPLSQRKSLRDNEEHLKNAHETIKAALGVDWTFEFDFELITSKCTDSYVQESLGECFYKEVATNVAECIAEQTKDEMIKEALLEANTNQKIIVAPNEDKKFTQYWSYEFVNGDLKVHFRPSIANISDVKYFKLASIIPSPGVFSLPARINLKENAEKFTEALEKAKEVTKMDWSYDESSLESVYPNIEQTYQERIGDIFSEIVTNICYNLATRSADAMVLEALQEIAPNAKIVFKYDSKQSDYWVWKFVGGDLVVSFKSICNTGDNSYLDFEKLL
ncbi:hypothetical protein ACTFIZ_000741 [Dictyostelium cf. discoideum]